MRSALVSALAGLVLGSATGCRSTDVHESMLEPAGHLDLRLKPCPQSPNCVSSQKWNAGGRVAPIPIEGGPEETLDRFAALIEADPRAEVVERQRIYLRAEYRSAPLRSIDDLELLVDEEGGVVHVRSASRLGWSDGGVNRRRVEALLDQEVENLVHRGTFNIVVGHFRIPFLVRWYFQEERLWPATSTLSSGRERFTERTMHSR